MVDYNRKGSEQVALAEFTTGTASSTPLLSKGVKLGDKFKKLLGLVSLGDMANETITIDVIKGDDVDLANPVVVKTLITTGQTYTLAGSASANDNKNVLVDIDFNDIDQTNKAKVWYGLRVTTGNTTGGVVKLYIFGLSERYPPDMTANSLNANYKDRGDDHASVVMIGR